jgi:hypothetical protein
LILCQLQKKAPVAATPTEKRLALSPVRVVKVVRSLWYRRKKLSPLSIRKKVCVEVRSIKITDRVPAGGVAPLAFFIWMRAMRLCRQRKSRAIPSGEYKSPRSMLGNTVVRSVNDERNGAVIGAPSLIDLFKAGSEHIEALVLLGDLASLSRNASHVLKQHHGRKGSFKNVEIRPQRLGPGVSHAPRRTELPLPRLREGLAWRSASQQKRLFGRETKSLKNGFWSMSMNISVIDLRPIGSIRSQGFPRISVDLNAASTLEARAG